jgi:hypothetical protein
MKRILSITILFAFVLFTVTSCTKWLEVQPGTKIKSADLLQTEQGYKDALIGVYTLMTPEGLYGRELSFGFFDALARNYDTRSTPYADLINAGSNTTINTYALSTVKPRIDQFWSGLYNIEANINNILDHIDADKNVFTGDNYSIIKGEALALRAFIHFDLFKMYGGNDPLSLSLPAIPYVKTLSINVVKSSRGDSVLSYIATDLRDAATYLQKDPIVKGQKKSTDMFLTNRNLRLNYYAVKGMMARVYLWQNRYADALAAAQEVMGVGNQLFPWISPTNLTNADNKNNDYTFSTEHLFALNVFNLQSIANNWFMSASISNQLCRTGHNGTTYNYEGLFENYNTITTGATDYRLIILSDPSIVPANGQINYYTLKKYYQPAGYNPDYAARIPLLRRSEMNYIAAESILGLGVTANYPTAVGYLNEVRQHRGITTDLVSNLSASSLRLEITKEYWKEFQGEGQFFFYCKRNNISFPGAASGSSASWANNSFPPFPSYMWALPKPASELQYNPN